MYIQNNVKIVGNIFYKHYILYLINMTFLAVYSVKSSIKYI